MQRLLLALAFFSAAILGCTKPNVEAEPSPESAARRTIYDYCDLYPCSVCPSGGCQPPLQALNFCCNPATGACVPTVLLGDCDPDDYAVTCQWGQTNRDGSITCYDG